MFDRRTALRGAGILGAALVCPACQGRPDVELRLAAGESGGFFWEFSGLLAAAAQRAGTDLITPVQSSGSADNLEALHAGRAELALSLIDTVYESPYRSEVTAIGCVYENYFQVAVRTDSAVAALADLRGRTVSTGASGSGAAALSQRVLAAAGLSEPGAVQAVALSMQDAAGGLADGAIDAAMWAGGLPTPAFGAAGTAIRLLDLSDVVGVLRQRFGTAYEAVPVPAGVYGDHGAVTTVGVANVLLARRDVPDGAAAGVVDLLIDDSTQLVPAQAVGSQFLDVQSLILTGDIALHPGAVEEYRRRHG